MISEKLERLIAARNNIKEALIAKGMDADTTYENYATFINGLFAGEDPEPPEPPVPEGLYRYLRINIDEIWGEFAGYYNVVMQMNEIQFFDSDGNAFVYPDQNNIGVEINNRDVNREFFNENIYKLFDGDVDRTKWCPNYCEVPMIITVDLGYDNLLDTNTYTTWGWWTGNDTSSYPDRNPRKMTIQVSNDKKTWIDFGFYESDESPAVSSSLIGPFDRVF